MVELHLAKFHRRSVVYSGANVFNSLAWNNSDVFKISGDDDDVIVESDALANKSNTKKNIQ